jgi:asparagine synthase (glutamine-hydrolysing)
MCGIVAAFGNGPGVTEEALGALAQDQLAHRGPDGFGVKRAGKAVIAHTRLAIVDVSGGHQPMERDDGRRLLACNGEIYNHRALRRTLPDRSVLATDSDSEVVLHLFAEVGQRFVSQLDGMFAFVVTDGDDFLVARDPFGIKPLYFGEDAAGVLWFASELKALQGRCAAMSALPPGTFMDASRRVTPWFEPAWTQARGVRWDAPPDELLARLEHAVVKRLMSDVPIGIFLSGGLDSSLIAALTRRHVDRLQTFAVGIEGAPDLIAARRVAVTLRTEHYERTYTLQEVVTRLEEVIYHLESYDPALVRSALPCFFVSELAARHVKVVLTGEGADELFAGYGYMAGIQDSDSLHRECVRLLRGLHAMNLQRVDRMTMAHGLEGRVPFLDVDFSDWAMSLDPRLKLRSADQPEKWLLRAAAAKRLPAEIATRPKLEFSAGSASEGLLEAYANTRVSDAELERAPRRFPFDTPRTKEELLYRTIFEDLFPGEAARSTVARWRVPAPMLS